jgi:hypothetical protein
VNAVASDAALGKGLAMDDSRRENGQFSDERCVGFATRHLAITNASLRRWWRLHGPIALAVWQSVLLSSCGDDPPKASSASGARTGGRDGSSGRGGVGAGRGGRAGAAGGSVVQPPETGGSSTTGGEGGETTRAGASGTSGRGGSGGSSGFPAGGRGGDSGEGGWAGTVAGSMQAAGQGGQAEAETCDDLDCGAQHRGCEEDAEGARCTDCSKGFEEKGGLCVCPAGKVFDESQGKCRSPLSCDDLCPGLPCTEATSESDAECVDACGTSEGWSAATSSCLQCLTALPCTAEGETGLRLATIETAGGSCICQTLPGFYFGPEGSVAEKCDADGDGWVNEKAQPSVESANPVLRENARCNVRYVPGFRLVSEQGQSFESKTLEDMTDAFPGDDSLGIPAGLPLYESPLNDGASGTRPFYGDGVSGRELHPEEVNSLTKACLSELGDTNDNGATDVEEEPGSELTRSFATGKLESYYEKYTAYAYYLELFDGWHDADAAEYVIKERARGTGGVPVKYPDGASDYVLECVRHPDTLYTWSGPDLTAPSSVGSDFIRFGDAPGIGHPSQFKCVHVVNALAYGSANEVDDPELVTVDVATGKLVRQRAGSPIKYAWTTNSCYATSVSAPGFPDNPEYPVLACATDVEPPPPGSVRWAAVAYEDYANESPYVDLEHPGAYQRGCENDCAQNLTWTECYTCQADEWGDGAVVPKDAGSECESTRVCDGTGVCGDCVPGDTRCSTETMHQICTSGRVWKDDVSCSFQCNMATGTCYPQCVPDARQCAAGLPQHCEADGTWLSEAACASGRECVGAGECLKSNGQTCSTIADCASNVCGTYYQDADGDGSGGTPINLCGSSPPDGYASSAEDCCDSDVNAKPGQSAYFVGKNACNSFDYDCVNGEEKRWPLAFDWSCSFDGWTPGAAVPGCGIEGNWYTSFYLGSEGVCYAVAAGTKRQECH